MSCSCQVTPDIFEMYLQPTRFLATPRMAHSHQRSQRLRHDWLIRVSTARSTLAHCQPRDRGAIPVPSSRPARRDSDTPAPPLLISPTATAGQMRQPRLQPTGFQTTTHSRHSSSAQQPHGPCRRCGCRRSARVAITTRSSLQRRRVWQDHLMHAICHKARQRGCQAVYVSRGPFTNDLVSAIRTNTRSVPGHTAPATCCWWTTSSSCRQAKHAGRAVPHLQHPLRNRQADRAGCDRPPKAMSTLESRLRLGFEWGLITDIGHLTWRCAWRSCKAKRQLSRSDLERSAGANRIPGTHQHSRS